MQTNPRRPAPISPAFLPLAALLMFVGCSSSVDHASYDSYSSISGAKPMAMAPPPAPHLRARMLAVEAEPERRQLFARKRVAEDHNTETYDHIVENPFESAKSKPLSTFAADVDTASYANVRRLINDGQKVPRGAARIEEMVNYFDYDYPQPDGAAPVAIDTEIASCPWAEGHQLARIGLRAKDIDDADRARANLVFLLDVSGSMSSPNKLPLLQRSLKLLVDQLDPEDRIAIAVYAGASGVVLDPTPCSQKAKILTALDALKAGGSTNGGEGIELAYKLAQEGFIKGGINRVILATDGDFNVGVTDQSELVAMIEEKAKSGVFLSVLGYGMGNLKDSTLEKLANRGNGNYAYIDTLGEARKVLVKEMGATLNTVAKDVKIQVEFNPARVSHYRLIGYENRLLEAEDFNDDSKDAGELGAGHTVTALYEIVPVGVPFAANRGVDPLKYQTTESVATAAGASDELMTVKFRYKSPAGSSSKLVSLAVTDSDQDFAAASDDFQFAAAVAAFGMRLRQSKHLGDASKKQILAWARDGRGADPHGYRAEFLKLVSES